MSKFNYVKMQATASRLLKKFGQSITIRVLTGETLDLSTQSKVSTYTDTTGNGVTLNFNNNEIDGSLILTTDIKLVIENLDIEPIINSITTIDSVTYRVSSVNPVNPEGTNIVYKIGLRK